MLSLVRSIPGGIFAAATPTYAADVTPLRLRGYLTVYVNLCWVIGKLICFSVLAGTLKLNNQWSYKIPFALQWVWPLPLMVLTYLAPESPWWLARQGRFEEAKRSLDRLVKAPVDVIDTNDTLAMITRTIEHERSQNIEGSYLECFKGTNLRRTEISMISWGCQILPGFVIQNYITYFFTLAGLPTADAFYLSIGEPAVLSWLHQVQY
jgi:SP family general alpha glucoside:H+ symporter-like MFS transporter